MFMFGDVVADVTQDSPKRRPGSTHRHPADNGPKPAESLQTKSFSSIPPQPKPLLRRQEARPPHYGGGILDA